MASSTKTWLGTTQCTHINLLVNLAAWELLITLPFQCHMTCVPCFVPLSPRVKQACRVGEGTICMAWDYGRGS